MEHAAPNSLSPYEEGDTSSAFLTYRAAMEMDDAFKKAMTASGYKQTEPIKDESGMLNYRAFYNAQRFSMMGSASQLCADTVGAESVGFGHTHHHGAA